MNDPAVSEGLNPDPIYLWQRKLEQVEEETPRCRED